MFQSDRLYAVKHYKVDPMPELFIEPINSRSTTRLAELGHRLQCEPWFDSVKEKWPYVITHEVDRLVKMLLSGSDVGGVLFQVRDTAEVLLKLTVQIVACDLIQNAPDTASVVRTRLLIGQTTLGQWIETLRVFAKLSPTTPEVLVTDKLRMLGRTDTDFYRSMDSYVARRNRDVGHGAYRKDSLEIVDRMQEQLFGNGTPGLVDAFKALDESRFWEAHAIDFQQLAGSTSEDNSPPFAATLISRADHAQLLDLSPLIATRECEECHGLDAFLFDAVIGRRGKPPSRASFMDYCNGHLTRVQAVDDRRLQTLVASFNVDEDMNRLDTGGEFTSQAIVQLLDDINFSSRYERPTWLRDALIGHMRHHTKGVLWVQAPAHIGKSIFVRGLTGAGLDAKVARREQVLLDDAEVALLPVFFKREHRFRPEQFANVMESGVKQWFRDDTSYRFVLDTRGDLTANRQAMVDFLGHAMDAIRRRGKDRLLVAIDGLDELPAPGPRNDEKPEASSPIDFIPEASQLPDDVTLLLTSRRIDDPDCPAWLGQRLGAHLIDDGSLCRILTADTRTEGYVKLLRDYVGHHSGWSPGSAEFEQVWETIYQRSDGLFLIVSFLCDLVREETA